MLKVSISRASKNAGAFSREAPFGAFLPGAGVEVMLKVSITGASHITTTSRNANPA
jgi:hypothetical protein